MKNNTIIKSKILFFLGFLILLSNCTRDLSDDAVIATFPKNGEVFIDGFSAGLEYLPFEDSYFEAFSVDEETAYAGESAMRFDVPNVGNPDGAYAGAIFPDYGGRDLSGFDALTFWAKATKAGTINEIGFGQDFRDNKYQVTLNNLELTTNWEQYIIAIPDPSKLTRESGLFWYAEGPEDGEGYTFWVDEVKFEKLGTVAQPRPSIFDGEDAPIQTFIGATIPINSFKQTVNLGNGQDQTINVAPSYFEFTSSDPSVATVNEQGIITAVSTGEAVITASLGGVDAKGSAKVAVTGEFVPAPTPTQDPTNVISIFSDAYTNQPVDYYNGYWAPFQTTQGQDDINVKDDNVIAYTELNFVGIQFLEDAPTINASSMTHLHIDIQPREDIQPDDYLIIRVADVGPDNEIGTGDDSSGEIRIDNSNLVNGEWYSLDVALSDLAGLAAQSNLAQIVFVSDATISSIFVDNIYFYNDGGSGPMGPTTAAPTPTQNAANVISVFSDAYTNIEGSDLNPDWGQATMVTELLIEDNNTLRYVGLDYQGLQLGAPQDVTGMDFLHIDYWTENSSALNAFLISGDETEVAKELSVPTSGWSSIDIPLGDFSPVDLADVIQLKFDGNGDIYLDNIYFYSDGGGGPTEPTEAAPTPMQNPANVRSIFSDAYTDIEGTEFFPDWGQSTQVEFEDIAGNNTMKYANFNYQGTQLASPQDLSDMEFIHIDMWTADATEVLFSPISFGTGAEQLVSLMPIVPGQWNSYDIPLSDFTSGGVTLEDIHQLKFDGQQGITPSNIYLDNIYFYGEGGSPTEPTVAAPTPMQDPANVRSIFSDAYMDIEGTEFFPDWGQSTQVEFEDIAGNNTMKYANFNYQGTQLSGPQDLSDMEFIHIDMWTADATEVLFSPISFGTGAEQLVSLMPIVPGQWNSYDIPLSDFTSGGVTLEDIHQLKFDGQQGTTPSNIYLDNIYFYGEGGGGGGDAQYCEEEVTHLGIAAETASAIKLTITNVDAQSMKVTIESANDDPVDVLIVNNLTGPITGSPTPSAIDDSVAGQLSITLTWTDTPPADIELNVLWSKASFGGNWQLGTENITVGFDESCP